MNWIDKAAELKFDKNISWTKLPEELKKEMGVDLTVNQIRDKLRHHEKYKSNKEKTIDIKAELLRAIDKEQEVQKLCDKLNTSERVIRAYIGDLIEEGYLITEVNNKLKLCKDLINENNLITEDWQGNKVIKFGVVSDTHLCSKWQQLTHLNTIYDIYEREGIKKVYHAGDLTEGVNMRRGHEYEIFRHGADEQAEYVIKYYPARPGVETEFITGNHDHSGIISAGHDIGYRIAKERPDMKYLGRSNAKVQLTPNCILEINHPLDGASYALSYTLQKLIDSMSGGEKPNMLVNGHHHKQLGTFYRNIHAYEVGTFQAQTPWMKGKRIAANMGGYIFELHVNDEGTIQRCLSEFIPFYKAIENDY